MATHFCLEFFIVMFLLLCEVGSYSMNSKCPYIAETMDCSEMELSAVPNDIRNYFKILYLNSNGIKEITADSFRGLPLLEEIDLSNNEIERIDIAAFNDLPNLRVLKLDENKLMGFPLFPVNSSLTHLHLSHNRIESVNVTSLSCVPQLRFLDLRSNQISDLNVTFPNLPHLAELFLNSNRITSLGNNGTFVNLVGLETLRLAKNHISRLDKDSLKPLTNLKHLELNKNRLTKIDGLTFNSMKNLLTLRLRRNNITYLEDGCFYGLDKIEDLELDSNNLSMVNRSWLYGLESLKRMSLTFNHIHDVEAKAWMDCDSLQHLDLSNNELTHMDADSFADLGRLDTLVLKNNRIAHIGPATFEDMTSLKTLNLNNNEVAWSVEDRIGVFDGLLELRILQLENNSIQSIKGGAFNGLGELTNLYLEKNNISTIEAGAFDELEKLEELHINTRSLLCDCNVAWLNEWLVEKQFSETVFTACRHPENNRDKNLADVSQTDFVCERDTIGLFKPMILKEPEAMIALKGYSVSLNCSFASRFHDPFTLHWRKDNFPITAHQINTTKSVMSDDVLLIKSELVIRVASDADTGSYQCMAVNEVGKTYSKTARIDVHVFPTFTKRPQDVTVKAALQAKLECAATGQPDPEISWQKDGGEDFPAARERRMQVMPNDVFMISNVKLEDQGVYTCTATNAAGTIMTNATLTVLEQPNFAEPMKDTEADSGDTVVLKCMAQGSPQPTIIWEKDGGELKMTKRHFFTAENQLLVIVETERSDAGQYTCRMKNLLGMKTDSLTLTINHVASIGSMGIFDDSTTLTGIIIIAVVCCVVLTSLIWVVIIYQTRRKQDQEYSATPTEETTVPHELAYTTIGEDGRTKAHYAPALMNGHANGKPPQMTNGRPMRQIVLGDGVHVTYNNGLQITHNPLANGSIPEYLAYESDGGHGEFQRHPAKAVVTTAQHHGCGSNSSLNQGVSSSTEETSTGGSSSSSSPGTQSTGLSTFNPYPNAIVSPTSPHNTSTQPLLGDEQYYSNGNPHRLSQGDGYHNPSNSSSQRRYNNPKQNKDSFSENADSQVPNGMGLKHSQSEHQYPSHVDHRDAFPYHSSSHRQLQHSDSHPYPNHKTSSNNQLYPQSSSSRPQQYNFNLHQENSALQHSHPHLNNTSLQQPDGCFGTFPRVQGQPHVHKTSSCSHLQNQGQPRQSLSALPEDGSSSSHPAQHSKRPSRSLSNHNASNTDNSTSSHTNLHAPSSRSRHQSFEDNLDYSPQQLNEVYQALQMSEASRVGSENGKIANEPKRIASECDKLPSPEMTANNNNHKVNSDTVKLPKFNDYVNVDVGSEQTALLNGQAVIS